MNKKNIFWCLCIIGLLIITALPLYTDVKINPFDDFDPSSEIQLPNDYEYSCTSEHSCTVSLKKNSLNKTILPEKIFELGYDDRYVIAKQYKMKEKYPNNPNNSYMIPDKDVIYYWILDTEKKIRFGPYYKIKDFEQKKSELGISNLKFKKISDYE